MRQEGEESEDKELLFVTRRVWKQNLILKLALGSLGGGGRRHLKYDLNVPCSWEET